jgi:hypothetical protein
MTAASAFWDALAPHQGKIENNLDLRSLRRIRNGIRSPVLVVGAGDQAGTPCIDFQHLRDTKNPFHEYQLGAWDL